MDQAYREELRSPADDESYERLIATGCATWAIVRASRLRLIAMPDQDPAEALRRRTQIVQTLTSAASSARPIYPVLSAWFDQLAGAMRLRWDEARQAPRTFRAFKDFSSQ
jgi:hypothetical protein